MTVDDLIEKLQSISERGGGDSEVLIATQPNYPIAFEFGGVADPTERLQDAFDRVHFLCQSINPKDDAEEKTLEIIEKIAEEFEVSKRELSKAIEEDRVEKDAPVWLLTGQQRHDDPYAPRNLWAISEE